MIIVKVYDKEVYLKQAEFVRTEILLISQEEMARKIGVSHMTYSRWVNGRVSPTYGSIQKIANFCDNYNVPPPEELKKRELPFGNIQTIRAKERKRQLFGDEAPQLKEGDRTSGA